MNLRFFWIPVPDSNAAEAELNAFLATHRVIAVERFFAPAQLAPAGWAVCVEWLPAGGGKRAGARAPLSKTYPDERAVRGGSWRNTAQNCRCACRNWNHRTDRNDNLGLRLAAAHPPDSSRTADPVFEIPPWRKDPDLRGLVGTPEGVSRTSPEVHFPNSAPLT